MGSGVFWASDSASHQYPAACHPGNGPASGRSLRQTAHDVESRCNGNGGGRDVRRCCAALISALVSMAPAAADEWPSRPVRMVNTFAAGGTADVLTRLVAEHLS